MSVPVLTWPAWRGQPDTPTQFVMKQINQTFSAANWPPGRLRQLADKSYTLECAAAS